MQGYTFEQLQWLQKTVGGYFSPSGERFRNGEWKELSAAFNRTFSAKRTATALRHAWNRHVRYTEDSELAGYGLKALRPMTQQSVYLVQMVRARTDPVSGLVDSWSNIASMYNGRFNDKRTVRQVRCKYYDARRTWLTAQGQTAYPVLEGINRARAAKGWPAVRDLAEPVMRAFLQDGPMPDGTQWQQVCSAAPSFVPA